MSLVDSPCHWTMEQWWKDYCLVHRDFGGCLYTCPIPSYPPETAQCAACSGYSIFCFTSLSITYYLGRVLSVLPVLPWWNSQQQRFLSLWPFSLGWVGFSRRWLAHDFCLFHTDCQTKVIAGSSELILAVLRVPFAVVMQCTVIS